jgi:hypothetical protein
MASVIVLGVAFLWPFVVGPTSLVFGGIAIALVAWAFVRFHNWRTGLRFPMADAPRPGPVDRESRAR